MVATKGASKACVKVCGAVGERNHRQGRLDVVPAEAGRGPSSAGAPRRAALATGGAPEWRAQAGRAPHCAPPTAQGRRGAPKGHWQGRHGRAVCRRRIPCPVGGGVGPPRRRGGARRATPEAGGALEGRAPAARAQHWALCAPCRHPKRTPAIPRERGGGAREGGVEIQRGEVMDIGSRAFPPFLHLPSSTTEKDIQEGGTH